MEFDVDKDCALFFLSELYNCFINHHNAMLYDVPREMLNLRQNNYSFDASVLDGNAWVNDVGPSTLHWENIFN